MKTLSVDARQQALTRLADDYRERLARSRTILATFHDSNDLCRATAAAAQLAAQVAELEAALAVVKGETNG